MTIEVNDTEFKMIVESLQVHARVIVIHLNNEVLTRRIDETIQESSALLILAEMIKLHKESIKNVEN